MSHILSPAHATNDSKMAQYGGPFFSRTPFRQFYICYSLASFLCKLPFWGLLSAVPYTRLQHTWTFTQSLTLYIAHFFVDTQACIGVTERLTLEPGRDGDRFQKIEPFTEDFYRGPLKSATVRPAEIGGVWFAQRPTSTPKGPIVLWIHGGAFVTGDGRGDDCAALAANLIEFAGVEAVFSVQYRLSGYGGMNPFPAALQDVLTAYLYLHKTCNIAAQSIIIAGNSSGANLVVAFVRYLEELMPQLDRPLCAVAASPWVVPLESLAPGYVASQRENYKTEYVSDSFHKWGATVYQPRDGVSQQILPYITLLGHPFATDVPILTTWGGKEVLASAIMEWVNEMHSLSTNKVEVYCDEQAVHASLFVGEKMGWGHNAKTTSIKIGEFIRASILARSKEGVGRL